MNMYRKALIEAVRDARQLAQELRQLGRQLREQSNEYRQASYLLSDLNRTLRNRSRRVSTSMPQLQRKRA
jgi:hypothetical protein